MTQGQVSIEREGQYRQKNLAAGNPVPAGLGAPIPQALLDLAKKAGFRFNGDDPWDVHVIDERLYQRVLMKGSLGLGEAYMEGWRECERLDQLFHRLLAVDADKSIDQWTRLRTLIDVVRHSLVNLQTNQRAFHVAEQHYDIGNDIFVAMLDPSMSYSCAYWHHAPTLAQAQRDKLDMICQKLELQPGERLLDIGCGWGGLAEYAARHFGVNVVGITVSKEQQKLARERCSGLPVSIELMDYRDLRAEAFDKIVSVGMFEHVGPKNYAPFFAVVARLLKNQGLFLLHTIGNYQTTGRLDPWINKYVFPNGQLPAASEVSNAIAGRFVIDDWHSFGPDYDRTLMAWWANLDAAWPTLEGRYGARFYRMWKYYLMSCAGFFRARQGQLWQLVLSKRARAAVYRSLRPQSAAST